VNRPQRQRIPQEFGLINLTVTTTPQPLSLSLGPSSLVSTLVFSVPTGQAQGVFLGNTAGVTITTGLEIPVGNPQEYVVINERELIELESPLLGIWAQILDWFRCRIVPQSDGVPVVVWDVTNMWVVASANTVLNVGTFKEMWL